MFIKEEDYNNIEGIEFLDLESNFDINDNMTIGEVQDELSKEFKDELNILGIMFQRNEDDERFYHLRGHYASALRYTLEKYDPMNDPKYKILKEDIGMGLEKYYYTYMIVPKLINEVYKKFFIDSNNKYLYSFQDGGDDFRLDSLNAEFGIKWRDKISEAINPNREKRDRLSDEAYDRIFEKSGMADLFKTTWIDEYNNRLGIIFSAIAREEVRTYSKIFNKPNNII